MAHFVPWLDSMFCTGKSQSRASRPPRGLPPRHRAGQTEPAGPAPCASVRARRPGRDPARTVHVLPTRSPPGPCCTPAPCAPSQSEPAGPPGRPRTTVHVLSSPPSRHRPRPSRVSPSPPARHRACAAEPAGPAPASSAGPGRVSPSPPARYRAPARHRPRQSEPAAPAPCASVRSEPAGPPPCGVSPSPPPPRHRVCQSEPAAPAARDRARQSDSEPPALYRARHWQSEPSFPALLSGRAMPRPGASV